MVNNPEFIVYTGPMFSGKTSRLFLVLEKYRHQKKKIAVFKPRIDDRYSQNEITSHSGWKLPATNVSSGLDILEIVTEMNINPQIIAVDEAFMIPGCAEALIWLYKNGYTVVVSALDMSFSGKTFHEIEKIMCWATRVEKCSAVCTVCGADAYYTHKKLDDISEIQVGGAETYEPRCAKCHPAIMNKDLLRPSMQED